MTLKNVQAKSNKNLSLTKMKVEVFYQEKSKLRCHNHKMMTIDSTIIFAVI